MGLAASQARFLGITARKSNIEYEGQQVNQQRMALAEEVNALYNKLLALDLPVAPDTTKFYETNYSFEVSKDEDLQGDYLVKSYFSDGNGKYNVTVDRTYTKASAKGTEYSKVSFAKEEVAEGEEPKIDPNLFATVSIGGKIYDLRLETKNDSLAHLINEVYGEGTIKPQPKPENEAGTAEEGATEEGTTEEGTTAEGTTEGETNEAANKYYFYVYTDDIGQPHYIDYNAVHDEETGYTAERYPEGMKLSVYVSSPNQFTETKYYEDVDIEFDANNRMCAITIPDVITNAGVDTTRTYDTEGYDEALRDYTMRKDEYDKMVAELNAQTESLQQEDKVLELRLNQIGTEQNELQTELEAVQAVLKKNIENTFKTFA